MSLDIYINNMIKSPNSHGVLFTPEKVLLKLLSEKDASIISLLKKYKSNPNKLNIFLMEIENERDELIRSTIGADTMVSHSLQETFKIASNSANYKRKKMDVADFVFSIISYHNNSGDMEVLNAIEDSGFDIAGFVNDYAAPANQITQPQGDQDPEESGLLINLNELAENGKIDSVIGREDEVLKVVEILSKRKKNNAVLLGKAGVGKTAIAEGLALSIVEGNVPEEIKNATVYSLEVASMIAGTGIRGQFEEKVKRVIEDFKEKEKKGEMPILFIDEIHTIVGSGNSSGLDLANIIKPALAKGELRCIGATTDAEWASFVNKDKALKRRFTPVSVLEPTQEQTLSILEKSKVKYEEKHEVTYSEESLKRIIDLSVEFVKDSALPDKAIDLMDMTGSIFKIKGQKEIGVPEVEFALSRVRNIPLSAIQTLKEKEDNEPLTPRIAKYLFGQDHAIKTVVKAVERSLAGLQDDDKPMGSFLFVGPTGVGKTELAKLLAKETKSHLERIDMSEYMEKHTVSKLIGSPPGYVDSDKEGRLQQAIGKNPRCVLLFDEIEKAHPDVMNILLQAMDNAKVTDSKGDEIDFRNTIIILTSNAGATEMNEKKISFFEEKASEKKIDSKAIESRFPPEFRNRLSAVVEFKGLPKESMIGIVDKYLNKLSETKLEKKGITLSVSEEAKNWIVDKTYDPNMGGRPIERGIQDYITEPITESILYGEIKGGKRGVKVSVKKGLLNFSYTKGKRLKK